MLVMFEKVKGEDRRGMSVVLEMREVEEWRYLEVVGRRMMRVTIIEGSIVLTEEQVKSLTDLVWTLRSLFKSDSNPSWSASRCLIASLSYYDFQVTVEDDEVSHLTSTQFENHQL